jgi:purine nucleosidase
MQPVLFDTDLGVDDALAIAMALNAPELDVIGLTVVSGNVSIEQGTRSALQLLELLGRDDVPVYVGAEKPLFIDRVDAVQVHGSTGLGYAELPEPSTLPVGRAVDHIIREIQKRPGELIVVAIGPLTNLALAERKSPGILNRARRVVAMGGALWCGGNITDKSEYNIYADPHALSELLQAQTNLTLIPLDVTEQLTLTEGEIGAACKAHGNRWTRFVQEATQSVFEFEQAQGGARKMHLHDPAVPALLIEPSLFAMRALAVGVETEGASAGSLKVLPGESEEGMSVGCAVDVDSARAMEFLRDRVLAS